MNGPLFFNSRTAGPFTPFSHLRDLSSERARAVPQLFALLVFFGCERSARCPRSSRPARRVLPTCPAHPAPPALPRKSGRVSSVNRGHEPGPHAASQAGVLETPADPKRRVAPTVPGVHPGVAPTSFTQASGAPRRTGDDSMRISASRARRRVSVAPQRVCLRFIGARNAGWRRPGRPRRSCP